MNRAAWMLLGAVLGYVAGQFLVPDIDGPGPAAGSGMLLVLVGAGIGLAIWLGRRH